MTNFPIIKQFGVWNLVIGHCFEIPLWELVSCFRKRFVVENFKFVVKLSKYMHGMLIAQKN
jgi:hypothetical protein